MVIHYCKIKLYSDWIIYILCITVVSFIFTSVAYYTTTMITEGMRPSIKITLLFGYALSRVCITPVFLMFFIIGRLFDKRINNKPIFLKK